jgi:Vps51/Vps67
MFAQNMAKSMTIDEMRYLHQRALSEAEAKRTELKLVLASRYRELVGSSDEVIKMKERSQELHELVQALPTLLEKVAKPQLTEPVEERKEESAIIKNQKSEDSVSSVMRRDLFDLPPIIYRALDKNDVHMASMKLIELFTLISSCTDEFPLANMLADSSNKIKSISKTLDARLEIQVRMTYLQMQTLPDKICRLASSVLGRAASYDNSLISPSFGAVNSAASLSTLNSLEIRRKDHRAEWLLNTYYDSKAKLLSSLLAKLSMPDRSNTATGTHNAESVLSNIILILQYDIVLHPYQIFVLRNFPTDSSDILPLDIMKSLPVFDQEMVKAKCSKFLSSHLPLIRNKVKSILVSIAGTTASALGQIRQSLYDKTDGIESLQKLNDNGVCSWYDAVETLVDIRTVLSSASDAARDVTNQRFSLWGALFSGTFSSLVHSLLTTAFQSVHESVISTLRTSLANAPTMDCILPHEAYRNTLRLATNLDEALRKVSEDAHELLVHAEERVESERRLRQSLYVQTCEIMGRLICELRRLAFAEDADRTDATKDFVIGRLCYLLKFRLKSLPTLLAAEASPASMRTTVGMINFFALQSAFELADHDEDGLITFEEAMEAAESAFNGTPFRGAEMVRETLLLSAEGKESKSTGMIAPTVTLGELSLLTAAGLRHELNGPESALGILQQCLDGIVAGCFQKWSSSVLSHVFSTLDDNLQDFATTATLASDNEWLRMFGANQTLTESPEQKGVSPCFVETFLECSCILNRNVCPSDLYPPISSTEQAKSLGLLTPKQDIPTLKDCIRHSLLTSLLKFINASAQSMLRRDEPGIGMYCDKAKIQLHADLLFVQRCTKRVDLFSSKTSGHNSKDDIGIIASELTRLLQELGSDSADDIESKHNSIYESSEMFFASLFGGEMTVLSSLPGDRGNTVSNVPLIHLPISSTRRFILLPVQTERSINEIQLRKKQAKEREQQAAEKADTSSGNVMSTGFGFFSSMLKKK